MEKKHFISVIIPIFNGEDTIEACLKSVLNSSFKNFEIIVVNDGSRDNSIEKIRKFPCRLINLSKRNGPAYARNVGVKYSKGNILFFMDDDMEINKNSLQILYDSFIKHTDVYAIIGVPEKISLSKGLTSAYNALRNHYLFYNSEERTTYFTTQGSAIKKKIFNKLNGFDMNFKDALVEDIEFGLRLPENKIYSDKKLLIKHHFPNFLLQIKKNLSRSFLMAKIIKKYKKMPKTYINHKRSFTMGFAFLSLSCLILTYFYIEFLILSIINLFIFILLDKGLFSFILKEKGAKFTFICIFYEYIFSNLIVLGSFMGFLSSMVKK